MSDVYLITSKETKHKLYEMALETKSIKSSQVKTSKNPGIAMKSDEKSPAEEQAQSLKIYKESFIKKQKANRQLQGKRAKKNFQLDVAESKNLGYHLREIKKGVLGEVSKIREELEGLEDALEQGVLIMALVKMSDLYGALQACAEKKGVTMDDLKAMHKVTKRAFESGRR